jgi:cysteinyl-tRNA synthetase
MTLSLYNTLTRKKDVFEPLDSKNVRMYVCGPTVYGRAHLGNARSVVVYDVLYRLLKHIYGPEHVTYARNITDVDDKINAAAKERKITIKELTTEVTQWFHEDMAALNVLPANDSKSSGLMIEPKATDHIAQMIRMIERLINNGHAYVAKGNVLFSVRTMKEYGSLSGRVQEELEAGARVRPEAYKQDASDFVLWKPADAQDDASSIFESPWGKGRPGWHIECSAMSTEYLGHDFDIHGGGSDLMFPHHENEIAQSCGAYPASHFARYWVHNGFLTVNGEKMSKSLGNFFTVKDLLDKGVKGEVIRYALLKTKYNEPLDWSERLAEDARKELDGLYRKLESGNEAVSQEFLAVLSDDMNTPKAMSLLHASKGAPLKAMGALLGILQQDPKEWFQGAAAENIEGDTGVQSLIDARIAAKKAKNWGEADKIRNDLKAQGILLEDRPDGTTDWRRA